MSNIEELKTELYRGRFKIKKESRFMEEMPQIIYKPDYSKIDDELGLHSDIADAILYCFRYINNKYTKDRPKKKTYAEKRMDEKIQKLTMKKKRSRYRI